MLILLKHLCRHFKFVKVFFYIQKEQACQCRSVVFSLSCLFERKIAWMQHFISADLTQNDVLGADHQQVAFKLLADFLLDRVVHVWRVIWSQLIDDDLHRQLNGQTVPVDCNLLDQLTAFDSHYQWTGWENGYNLVPACLIVLILVAKPV